MHTTDSSKSPDPTAAPASHGAAPLHDDPPRVIGPVGAFAVVAGSMLGVGIFLFAPRIAEHMGSELGLFAMLLVGGLFAWAGSVACGELGAMMPRAGGDYVFQREAFGPSMAFASGWVLFVAIFAGSTASMSVAVFQYDIGPLIGVDLMSPLIEAEGSLGHVTGGHLAALGLILLLTFINDLGTAVAAGTQTLLTLAPIAALTIIGIWGLVSGEGGAAPAADLTDTHTLTLAGVAASFLFVNFIFSGWINIIYVAAEVKEPGRTIPRAMVSATAAVTALYVLLAFAFIAVLGFGGLADTFEAGTAMAGALGGDSMKNVVLLIISVAIITSINATILAAARVGYAMARDGAFVKAVGRLSPKTRTPRTALWVQAGIAMVIVVSGTFDAIVKMTSIAMFVTGSLTVLAVFVLRRTRADLPRPYRATFYPVLPALYVVLALLAIGLETWNAVNPAPDVENSWFPLLGLAILVLAWAGHLLYRRNARGAATVVGLVLLAGGAMHLAGRPEPVARAAPQGEAAEMDPVLSGDERVEEGEDGRARPQSGSTVAPR
jgi:APA family basic amino acid/polyamine antiporter